MFATVQPLHVAKDLFQQLTAHVKLEEVRGAEGVLGYRTSLADVLTDAIKYQQMGLSADSVNDLKITGDGGRLCPKHPMTCMFVQSMMMKEDQQGLHSATPLVIMTASETYDVLKRAAVKVNEEMKQIEKEGLIYKGIKYLFRFFFGADLKFMWLVRHDLECSGIARCDSLLLVSWVEDRGRVQVPVLHREHQARGAQRHGVDAHARDDQWPTGFERGRQSARDETRSVRAPFDLDERQPTIQ